jgi:hypothetical protein
MSFLFYWNYGLHSLRCGFCTKLEGHIIHSATCLLGLNQHTYVHSDRNLLELVFFFNFADLFSVVHVEYGVVRPAHCHSPFITDLLCQFNYLN